jgi:hypothetical protein
MVLRTVLLVLAGAAILINGFSIGMVMAALDKRGYKTNTFLIRLYFPKYLGAYRDITRQEAGKTGPFFILWIGSFISILVFGLAALLLKNL